MRLYNTLSRRKEILKPLKKGRIGLYTCGPTVYDYAHIGNLRTYLFEDILQKTLERNGYRVKRAMNITDVGHLTGDTDRGDDKVDKKARAEKKTPAQIADFYTAVFLKDLKKLNIKRPEIIAPATKYIKEEQALIKELFRKKYAYETETAVYFDVARFGAYGKLSGQSLKEKMVAARKEVIEDPRKKNSADFALWFKLVGRFKKHSQRWNSPWGRGFPGWHIECSAISRKFLGQPFDIHTGGVDHIGTHHENEIAQAKAAYGKPLAKFWLHGEFLVFDKKRMGKSERNILTLADLEKKGFNPLTYRYLVLNTHYRKKIHFSWESLAAASGALEKINRTVVNFTRERSKDLGGVKLTARAERYLRNFLTALNNDLNTPRALAVLHAAIRAKNLTLTEKRLLVKDFDAVLGLNLGRRPPDKRINPKVKRLVQTRELFRRNKQFAQADALRKKIRVLGYEVEDTPLGPRVTPKKLHAKNKPKTSAPRSRS